MFLSLISEDPCKAGMPGHAAAPVGPSKPSCVQHFVATTTSCMLTWWSVVKVANTSATPKG